MAPTSFCCEADKDAPEIQYLQQPILYCEEKSQKFKNLFTKLFTIWFPFSQEQLTEQDQFTSLLGSTILICDDICDASSLRQGIPTAHLIFGIPLAIKAINYGLSISLNRIVFGNTKSCIDIYIDNMIKVTRGQVLEVTWRNRCICPTEEQYLNDVIQKTSNIAILMYKLAQETSETKLEDMSQGLTTFSQSFQIVNDYIDLASPAYNANNSSYQDITAGTFSFPLIHAIRSHPEDDRIMNILKEKTSDVEKIKICLSLLEKYGSFDYTKKRAEELIDKTREEFSKFSRNPQLQNLIDWTLKQLDPNAPLTPLYSI